MKQIIIKVLSYLSEFSTKEALKYFYFFLLLPFVLFLKKTILTGLQTQIPLWIGMLPMLVVLGYFSIRQLIQSYKKPTIKYFIYERLYWEILVNKDKSIEIQKEPYCLNHLRKLYVSSGYYQCLEKDCKCKLDCHYIDTFRNKIKHLLNENYDNYKNKWTDNMGKQNIIYPDYRR